MDSDLANLLDRQPRALIDGIPRFGKTLDEDQRQTEESFAYKWETPEREHH